MTRVRRCRVCGCTDANACPGGCAWYAATLCTSCIAHATRDELDAAYELLLDEAADVLVTEVSW